MPCGLIFKERDCKGSVTVLDQFKPIKIRFTPKKFELVGENVIPDLGKKIFSVGEPFGNIHNDIFLNNFLI